MKFIGKLLSDGLLGFLGVRQPPVPVMSLRGPKRKVNPDLDPPVEFEGLGFNLGVLLG